MPAEMHARRWELTLYVSGASPQSTAAIACVRRLCDEQLHGRVDLRIVDVHEHPRLALENEVVAAPMLIRSRPEPVRRLVGCLGDPVRLRALLDLGAVTAGQRPTGPVRARRRRPEPRSIG